MTTNNSEEIKYADLWRSFERIGIYLQLCKIEMQHFKGIAGKGKLNGTFGRGVCHIENTLREAKKIVGKQEVVCVLEQQLADDKVNSIGEIIQVLSACTTEQLNMIEDEFLKAKQAVK